MGLVIIGNCNFSDPNSQCGLGWQSNAVVAPVGGGIPSKVKGKVAGINNFNGGSNRGSHSSTFAVGINFSLMSNINAGTRDGSGNLIRR